MEHARPLPPDLLDRYRAWQARRGPEELARYAEVAAQRQNPKAMIITCCDSRVLVSEIFGNAPGDFFIHRNIANLVPPHEPDGRAHGTSAAIEYAVIALGIEHLIVMGHHGCGGVRGCHDMLAGLAPDLDTPDQLRRHLAQDPQARLRGPVRPRPLLRGPHRRPGEGGGAGQPRQPDDLPLRRRSGRNPASCSSTASGRTSATATWKATTAPPGPSRGSDQTCESIGSSFTRFATKRCRKPVSGSSR